MGKKVTRSWRGWVCGKKGRQGDYFVHKATSIVVDSTTNVFLSYSEPVK